MKPVWKNLLCAVLAAATLLSLCACKDADPNAGLAIHEDITLYCFITPEENGGGYACAVSDVHKNYLFRQGGMSVPPQVEAVSENTIKVSYQPEELPSDGWVVFCNIARGYASPQYRNLLATKGVYIAYAERRTDVYHVFVQDGLDETAYLEGYPLEDADEGSSVLGGQLNEEGDLEVTYLSNGKEKTAVVDMP